MLSDQFLLEIGLDRAPIPSFDAYPFSLDAVRNLDTLALHRSVTFIIGENGSGKSTLLEALAVAWGFNAKGGITRLSYEETEHYQVTRNFLSHDKMMLRILMAE